MQKTPKPYLYRSAVKSTYTRSDAKLDSIAPLYLHVFNSSECNISIWSLVKSIHRKSGDYTYCSKKSRNFTFNPLIFVEAGVGFPRACAFETRKVLSVLQDGKAKW